MKCFNYPKPRQELMTLLEPRRMMSATGGVDYMPAPDTAPTQISHSVGDEHRWFNSSDAHPPMPMNADFDGQFALALAQGLPLFVNLNAGNAFDTSDAPSHPEHSNAFTTMYASLSNSTAQSIDDAIANAAKITLGDMGVATVHASISSDVINALDVTATPVVKQDLTVSTASTATSAVQSVGNLTPIHSVISSAVILPAAPLTSAVSATVDTSTLSRITLQTVEQELLTVSNLASEMISQLGRDLAIQFSHLERDLGLDSMSQQLATHIDGWRSAAAVTGAAIATIVYIQSEADREKSKTNPTFSSTMIQAVPS